MITLYAELVSAFMLLTRLPINAARQGCTEDTFVTAVWAYPIVGTTIGAIGAAVYVACSWIGLPATLGAICSLGVAVLATGGLHEDALADVADGFGGGRSRERKLEIMRDSRVGAFGVLALVFAMAARGAAIASIAVPSKVAAAMVTAGALGRGVMVVPLLLLAPARTDGLGERLATASASRSMIALALAALTPLLLLSVSHTLCVITVALAMGLYMTALARRQVGGYTGDVLGATEVMVECAVLAALATTGTVSLW